MVSLLSRGASDRAVGPPKVETRASEKTRSLKPTPRSDFREPGAFGPKDLVNGFREQTAPPAIGPSAAPKAEALDDGQAGLLHLISVIGSVPLMGPIPKCGGHADQLTWPLSHLRSALAAQVRQRARLRPPGSARCGPRPAPAGPARRRAAPGCSARRCPRLRQPPPGQAAVGRKGMRHGREPVLRLAGAPGCTALPSGRRTLRAGSGPRMRGQPRRAAALRQEPVAATRALPPVPPGPPDQL